jgi:transcriptional regulator with XRE-family HTH domain
MAARTTPQALVLREGSPWSARRVAAGLSIRRLSALSGISRADLSRIDQGRQIPTPDQAAKMLEAIQSASEPTNDPEVIR